MGAVAAAIRAASEEMRKTSAIASHVAHVSKPTGQEIAIIMPSAVATPLPPLNFKYKGKR
jgi:hypothetical protein